MENLVNMNLTKVVEMVGEQETIEMISDLIAGDAMREKRAEQIINRVLL